VHLSFHIGYVYDLSGNKKPPAPGLRGLIIRVHLSFHIGYVYDLSGNKKTPAPGLRGLIIRVHLPLMLRNLLRRDPENLALWAFWGLTQTKKTLSGGLRGIFQGASTNH